jgi:hypothetical protein
MMFSQPAVVFFGPFLAVSAPSQWTFLSELQDTINAKNKKINEYIKNCDECWLLVVADRTKADQRYCLTPEITSHRFVSKFRKTFFLEIAESDFLELSTI